MMLTERLDPARYETLLICGRPDKDEGDMLDLRGPDSLRPIIVRRLHRAIAPLDDLIAFVLLVRLLRSFRPDVVHTHLAKAGLLGRLAARVVGVPVVVHTFHGNVLRGYFHPWVSRSFALLERLLAHLSTRVIVLSPRQRAEILSLGIASNERIVEIPLGLDLGPLVSSTTVGTLRAELGVPASTSLVGTVARFVPIKGVDVLLDAAARVIAERPDTIFVLVGDGELSGPLRRQAADLGIGDRVRFLGWRADMAAIYSDLDVVVLTSHNEGTPVTIIEALAAGRAVVATAVGGVPDLLGDSEAGVLVPDRDVNAIARAVLDLLGDAPRRFALGEAGRRRVYPAYDVGTLVARVDSLYATLARADR